MDINQLKSNIKSGKISGVYIFTGEEEYLARHYLGLLKSSLALDDALAVFNNPRFDTDKASLADVKEAIKAPPMMSDYKLVEWHHKDFSSMKEGELSELEEIVGMIDEYPYAVVAFTASADAISLGTEKKPSPFAKRFAGKINILRFDKSTENQLYSWLKKHFDANGVGVTLDTLRALVFRSGHSMDVLNNEVEKLSALAKARGTGTVTAEMVDEVASSTPEADTYALSNAITDRNKQAAYSALEEMKFRRVDPTVVMGMIARTFDELLTVSNLLEDGHDSRDIERVTKMKEFKARIYIASAKKYKNAHLSEAVSNLARIDAASKFGGVAGYTAIELFISQYL